MSLFVNVEPSTLTSKDPILCHEEAMLDEQIRVVVEFTERDLSARPAEILGAIRWLRSRGCGIALDDVGADESSLALLPFLSPDVIKLDMSLVQQRDASRRCRACDQRRGGRGRALGCGAARRGNRDRGAPRPGARDGRDARPGLVLRTAARTRARRC